MMGISSVEDACAAFPSLKWREMKVEQGRAMLAIVEGDRERGDITALLAMEDGATAPCHTHGVDSRDWPAFSESTACLVGEMHGMNPDDPSFVLHAGQSIDLRGEARHQPFVPTGKFALVLSRHPCGSVAMEAPSS